MKLSAVTTKLTCMKSNAFRVLGAATLAGAFLTAGAPAAQAQHVSFGVSVGPRYVERAPIPPRDAYGYAPGYYDRGHYDHGYYGRGYDDRRFFEERRRHEEFLRHEAWEREHRYGFGYDRPYGR